MDLNKISLTCRLCSEAMKSKDELEFGRKPLCNFFPLCKTYNIDFYNLAIGQCAYCGLVQLTQHPSASSITPKHSWVSYNEPELHLSEVSDYLNSIYSGSDLKTLGLGPFERPLMDLLQPRFKKNQVNMHNYISSAENRFPYLEAYEGLTSETVKTKIKNDFGASDLVVCRYLLEHSDRPVKMMQSLGYLLNAGGRLLIEIPDSKKFLESCDYSFIWEEHLSYFTDATFRRLAEIAGFQIIKSMRFSGLLEDALVYILKPIIEKYRLNSDIMQNELNIFEKYKENFSNAKKNYLEELELLVSCGKKIALFGAGHQAIMFINLFELDRYLTFIIDDDANKIGTYFPGTDLKIICSNDAFKDNLIDIVLLAVSPKIEQKIAKKFNKNINERYDFYSIFEKSDLGTLIRK